MLPCERRRPGVLAWLPLRQRIRCCELFAKGDASQGQNSSEQNGRELKAMFDLARIERCGLVARIDYHESIGSTSDRAIELGGRDEAGLPLLVLAERQTAG